MKNILFSLFILFSPLYLMAQVPAEAKDTIPSLTSGDIEDDFAGAMEMAQKIIILDQQDTNIPKEYNKKEERFFYESRPSMDNENFSIRALPKEYSGFKIQLLRVEAEPLADDDIIFFRHGNVIEEEVGKEEFAYLIGNFKTEDEALLFIERNLLFDLYPEAIIIQYKDSSRI